MPITALSIVVQNPLLVILQNPLFVRPALAPAPVAQGRKFTLLNDQPVIDSGSDHLKSGRLPKGSSRFFFHPAPLPVCARDRRRMGNGQDTVLGQMYHKLEQSEHEDVKNAEVTTIQNVSSSMHGPPRIPMHFRVSLQQYYIHLILGLSEGGHVSLHRIVGW